VESDHVSHESLSVRICSFVSLRTSQTLRARYACQGGLEVYISTDLYDLKNENSIIRDIIKDLYETHLVSEEELH